jgi:ParB family chromosome partitioning protein
LTVAQSEDYIESLLQQNQKTPPQKRPGYIVKDVRLFLNTIRRSVQIMQRSGVDARVERAENDETITVTVMIPKKKA